MKLDRFCVKNYKVIDDTGFIKVDPNVTALVGKNESGKSAILRSLRKSHNVADVDFDKLFDYPRDRYSRDRKGSQEVTILEFSLLPDDQTSIAATLPAPPTAPISTVTYTTFYDGEEDTRFAVSFGKDIEAARKGVEAHHAVDAVLTALADSAVSDADSITEAGESAKAKIDPAKPIWNKDSAAALEGFRSAIAKWVQSDEARASLVASEREEVAKLANEAKEGNPWDKARTWVSENLPAFIYFDNYGQLDTRIHLPAYLKRRAKPDEKLRTQTALFEWSGLDPEEILNLGKLRAEGETEESVQRRYEKRRALLDSASFSLTGDWVDWWAEKRHKLHFDADGEDLVLKVSDTHNEFPIPFEERSHGFQWFFSFYLVFLVESKKAHKGAILLLDEPGLHLHPTLQAKLIALFDRISETNQLIYSTHLPFLVDGNHLERVRTVHLAGPEPQKTVVSTDVRPTGDRDTLFPLQAAAGYSIAQTLFLGKRSLIIEGIIDYWLLKALDACGKSVHLHSDTVLIPAGGTSRLMPLASIMLASTGVGDGHLIVLLDSDTEGKQAAGRLQDVFQDGTSIIMLGPAIGLPEATIEDLIPRDVYVAAANQAGYSVALNSEELAASTNVGALEKAFQRNNLGKFSTAEKAATALVLIDTWGKDPSSVPDTTRQRADALLSAINTRFDGVS